MSSNWRELLTPYERDMREALYADREAVRASLAEWCSWQPQGAKLSGLKGATLVNVREEKAEFIARLRIIAAAIKRIETIAQNRARHRQRMATARAARIDRIETLSAKRKETLS